MPRPLDYSALPSHPAVSSHYRRETKYGWATVVADVTCPSCAKVRTFPLYTLRQQMSKPGFNGQCRTCGQTTSRANTRATLEAKNTGKRRTTASGYVAISDTATVAEDRSLFDAMRGKGSFVLEHRMAMARHLGRPLESWELVDHMNGDKADNSIGNLRLYVKGKNGPGSSCGHGTYYHEWQMALARIKKLGG